MEVVPAGKPQSSFRSHHFRLLSLLLNNLGRYNKRIGIYMEFSLAKMRLKDAATIMNNKARCLPFFDCHSQRRERRKKGEKEREKVEQEIEVVGEKTKASVWVDLCKRPFNCKKTPTITKNKKYGLGLFFFFNNASFVSRKQFKKKLRVKKQKRLEQDLLKLGEGRQRRWELGEGLCIVC